MKNQVSVLIISGSGQLRASLQVLLAAIPQVEIVKQADNVPPASAMGAQYPPALVLLDCDLPHAGPVATLGQIKAEWPRTRFVVLVDDEQEQQAAKAAGADVVLMKGVLASRFLATVEDLLTGREDN